jgi:hypothetical protein
MRSCPARLSSWPSRAAQVQPPCTRSRRARPRALRVHRRRARDRTSCSSVTAAPSSARRYSAQPGLTTAPSRGPSMPRARRLDTVYPRLSREEQDGRPRASGYKSRTCTSAIDRNRVIIDGADRRAPVPVGRRPGISRRDGLWCRRPAGHGSEPDRVIWPDQVSTVTRSGGTAATAPARSACLTRVIPRRHRPRCEGNSPQLAQYGIRQQLERSRLIMNSYASNMADAATTWARAARSAT